MLQPKEYPYGEKAQLCSSIPSDCRLGSGTFSRIKRGVLHFRCFRLHKMNTWARARLKMTNSISFWTTPSLEGLLNLINRFQNLEMSKEFHPNRKIRFYNFMGIVAVATKRREKLLRPTSKLLGLKDLPHVFFSYSLWNNQDKVTH